jgi:hypothetical protein
MEEIEDKTDALEEAYEPDYEMTDIVFFEPFVVMKPIGIEGYAWWNGPSGRSKVQNLINAFKMDMTVMEGCIQAGISLTQYKYFCRIHPTFVSIKARCKQFSPIVAKQGLMNDIASKDGFRSRQWFLERKQPHIYGRDIGAYTPPPTNAVVKVTAEAFLDKDGEMVVSKQMAELLDEYGDSENTAE